jgi:RNA polymerase sigma factor (sigma-70 family)
MQIARATLAGAPQTPQTRESGATSPGPMSESSAAIDATLVDAVIAGDPDAWQRLVLQLHEAAEGWVARRHRKRDVDFRRAVALRVVERVSGNEFRALRGFLETRERYPGLAFDAWIFSLIRNSAVDELRALPEFQRRQERGERKLVALPHVALDESHGWGDDARQVRRAIEVRRILRWIHDPNFPGDQRRAILLWLDGNGRQEIADNLSCSAEKAERLLRAARQRLRRQFEGTP